MSDMPRGRDPKITGEDVIECAKTINDPAFLTAEIADRLDVSPPTARARLESLAEQGIIAQKGHGRPEVWWIRCDAY